MTQLTDKVFVYPIPDEAVQVTVHQFKHSGRSIPYWHINWNYPKDHRYTSGGACFFYKMLGGKKKYPTNLKVLFTTKTATEEDARKVVEPVNNPFLKEDKRYRDYTLPQSHTVADAICTAIESLRSLLRSKGLDEKNNFALIEKEMNDGTE